MYKKNFKTFFISMHASYLAQKSDANEDRLSQANTLI